MTFFPTLSYISASDISTPLYIWNGACLIYCYLLWHFRKVGVLFSSPSSSQPSSKLSESFLAGYYHHHHHEGARVAQWWEQSPPTSVAWVQIPASCLSGLSFSSFGSFAPRAFSLGTPVVSSLLKPTFPNSNSTRNQVDEVPLGGCATSKSLLFSFVHRQSSTTASFICLMKMSLQEALRKGVSAF